MDASSARRADSLCNPSRIDREVRDFVQPAISISFSPHLARFLCRTSAAAGRPSYYSKRCISVFCEKWHILLFLGARCSLFNAVRRNIASCLAVAVVIVAVVAGEPHFPPPLKALQTEAAAVRQSIGCKRIVTAQRSRMNAPSFETACPSPKRAARARLALMPYLWMALSLLLSR